MSRLSSRNSKGVALPIVVVAIVIFLAIGLGVGYLAVPTHTTTQAITQSTARSVPQTATQTTTQTIVQTTVQTIVQTTSQSNASLVNFWKNSFAWSWTEDGLSRSQLVSVLNAGNASIYLLDIRQPSDYAKGHIGGAINTPFQNMTTAVSTGTIQSNKIIITICYSGDSAGLTAATLRALGYNAFDLWGGMAGWNNATSVPGSYAPSVNYPIVTGSAPGTWTVWNP